MVSDEHAAPVINDLISKFRPPGDYSTFGDYVNPFVEYLQLIFYLAQKQELENLPLMVGESMIGVEREQINRLLNGESLQAVTYAFIETGRASWLDERSIHLPAHFIDPDLP